MSRISSPIIVLDSGLGGLTVARAIRSLMPAEDLIYFGDTARVPYGSKSASTVTGFLRQILAYLQPYEAKHIVVACNTATALALPNLRAEFPNLSISGVIEPGARAAVEAAGDRKRPIIGIIGTEATIKSKAYEHAVLRRRQYALLYCRPTPLLVPLIEEGRSLDDPVVKLTMQGYLLPLIDRRINVLVLGCTHYPVYKGLIAQVCGADTLVIDSADKCAEDVRRRLRTAGRLRVSPSNGINSAVGTFKAFVTDDPVRFASLASRFLGLKIAEPTFVPLDDLHETATVVPMTLKSAV